MKEIKQVQWVGVGSDDPRLAVVPVELVLMCQERLEFLLATRIEMIIQEGLAPAEFLAGFELRPLASFMHLSSKQLVDRVLAHVGQYYDEAHNWGPLGKVSKFGSRD